MAQLPSSWIGYTLNGRYHIESLLGRGGMSTVYRANDPNLQRTVAVKIIHPHLTENPQFIQRFEQEATAVARLRHPNIVQVHDFDHEEGIYYMVLEYIPGETLAHRLQSLNTEHSHMLPAQCIRILTDLCLAVDYAHQRGMVHRDLKPANVMVNRLGAPVLMDFGIAKLLGRMPASDDQEALGTARYMSPEQIQGYDVDHRSDIYALGVMLYEMLLGEPPFTGSSSAEIMAKHLNEPVPGIKGRLTAVPDALTSIILTAMAKDPAHRYQSATEMATALQSIGIEIQKSTGPLGARHWEHLSRLLQQAETAVANHDDLGCLEKLEELERTGADFAPEQVANLRQAARARLYEQALALFQAGRFDDSLALVGQLQPLAQDWPNLTHLESQIRQAQKTATLQASLDQLYDEAAAALEKGDYTTALAIWQTLETQRGQLAYSDPLQVVDRARRGLCTDLYAQAQTAVAAGQPAEALSCWAQIQDIDPNFPDSAGVVDQAHRLRRQRQQQNDWQRRLMVAVPLLAIFLVGGMWLARGRVGGGAAAPTATVLAAVVLPTATPTARQTPTAVPPTATIIPSRTPTAVPPTATIAPTTTSASTALPADVALAKEDASIFAGPQTSSAELAVVAAGEVVQVLGRSEVRNWLFVGNGEVAGFIFQPLLQWTGDVSELPVFTYTDAAPEEATPPSGSSVITPLQIDLWALPDTVQCRDGRWSQRVFIQGQGGNGRYRYYWQDQALTGPTSGSYSFTANSDGGVIIGTGRVVSGDGQVAERELFIPIPSCPSEP
ncbi:MAG: protein kinase [Ardenticatenaceae bacterium]|nr:protein kinase [Ardenticatenaceae bacterium]